MTSKCKSCEVEFEFPSMITNFKEGEYGKFQISTPVCPACGKALVEYKGKRK